MEGQLKEYSEYIINESKLGFEVLIFGKSGAGKTSLLRHIFQAEIGTISNDCKPVKGFTQHRHPDKDKNFSVWDFEGLEVVSDNKETLKRFRNCKPNVIWLVVQFLRVEDNEIGLIKYHPNVPVLVIINHIDFLEREIPDFETCSDDDLQNMCKSLKLVGLRNRLVGMKREFANLKRIIPARLGSGQDRFENPIGIKSVIEETMKNISNVAMLSFISNVELEGDKRFKKSMWIVQGTALSGAVTDCVPVPGLGSWTLTSLQVIMIISILKTYGFVGNVDNDPKALALVLIQSFVPSLATMGSGWLLSRSIGEVLKGLPFINVLGIGINASVGYVGTCLLGVSVASFLRFYSVEKLVKLNDSELKAEVEQYLQNTSALKLVKEAFNTLYDLE